MNRWIVSIAIWGLYGVALLLPAQIDVDPNGSQVVLGCEALLYGWAWPGTIPELANVALIVGWISFLRGKARLTVAAGVLAVALSVTAPAIYGSESSKLGTGYFLWVASCVALTIPAVFNTLRRMVDALPMPTRVTVSFTRPAGRELWKSLGPDSLGRLVIDMPMFALAIMIGSAIRHGSPELAAGSIGSQPYVINLAIPAVMLAWRLLLNVFVVRRQFRDSGAFGIGLYCLVAVVSTENSKGVGYHFSGYWAQFVPMVLWIFGSKLIWSLINGRLNRKEATEVVE